MFRLLSTQRGGKGLKFSLILTNPSCKQVIWLDIRGMPQLMHIYAMSLFGECGLFLSYVVTIAPGIDKQPYCTI